MLSYLIVDHLHERFSCLEGFFRRFVQGFVYNLTFKLSFILIFFQMVHNEKIFRRFSVKYRTFSEDPTCSDVFPLCSWKIEKLS